MKATRMARASETRERADSSGAPGDSDGVGRIEAESGRKQGAAVGYVTADPAIRTPGSSPEVPSAAEALEEERAVDRAHRRRDRRERRLGVAVLAAILVGIALFLVWRSRQPIPVDVVRPERRSVMETVTASGRVGGRRETVVGAQVQGVVAELYVDEGDAVRRGQPLARIQNDVALAQVAQAEQALRTARAQLAQAAAGPRASEVRAAQAQVRQAQATVRQREAQVDQARAAVRQAEARQELARQNLERYRFLLKEGAIARQNVDQAETDYRTAAAEVASAREGVATAQANLAAARAAVVGTQAQLRTVQEGPREEVVEVARQRVREAQAVLQVAREQNRNSLVRAPFDGTVTEILAERGAAVSGPNGVVRLVQTPLPEIRVDVDETNLADLRVGQRAVVTSPTYRGARLEGRVTEIGAQVDPARGTVEVTVVPRQAPDWLRPGETVDVNIITAEAASRLVIPTSAVRRIPGIAADDAGVAGERSVLVVRQGRAVPIRVRIGPVDGDLAPVLSGLSREDAVIRRADQVEPGTRVVVRD